MIIILLTLKISSALSTFHGSLSGYACNHPYLSNNCNCPSFCGPYQQQQLSAGYPSNGMNMMEGIGPDGLPCRHCDGMEAAMAGMSPYEHFVQVGCINCEEDMSHHKKHRKHKKKKQPRKKFHFSSEENEESDEVNDRITIKKTKTTTKKPKTTTTEPPRKNPSDEEDIDDDLDSLDDFSSETTNKPSSKSDKEDEDDLPQPPTSSEMKAGSKSSSKDWDDDDEWDQKDKSDKILKQPTNPKPRIEDDTKQRSEAALGESATSNIGVSMGSLFPGSAVSGSNVGIAGSGRVY